MNFENIEKVNFRDHDSILIEAGTQYESTYLKRIMQGEPYRKA
jgi:hypothetical protein